MKKTPIRLRTPISYYGGKQRLAARILNNIPPHELYVEPFLGGAAIYFAKEACPVEVINDTNQELGNFYKVTKNRLHDLQALVRTTLHSRMAHDDAWCIYNKPHLHDEVRRAWAVWVLSTQSFASKMNGSWGHERQSDSTPKKVTNKRDEFTEQLAIRLQGTQIECSDALYLIKRCDTAQAFIYGDPPYYNSDMGHYDGYTVEDFELLLKCLSEIKGKFLLSSYPSPLLNKYIDLYGWHSLDIEQALTLSKYRKKKVEVLTANYELR